MLIRTQAGFQERTKCINCGSDQLTEVSSGKFTDEPLRGFIDADPWGESPMPYLQDAEWSLVECQHCRQVFHRWILNAEWNEKRFSSWMTAEAIREFEAPQHTAKHKFTAGRSHVVHVLQIEKLTRPLRKSGEAVRLLDFGAGWGDFLLACKTFGLEACGVDRSTARMKGASTDILPSLGDVRALAPFHAITLFEVLEHLDAPDAILSELSALIAPGGILVLETPDCTGVTNIRAPNDYRAIHPLDHINAFTHDTLRSIAERQGFQCISRGIAHVTADRLRIAKTEARHILGRDANATQLYFRKT